MNFNITAYSTPLFSTWIFIEELGLLFDAGDGLSAGLLQKSRKIKHAFISHADRDHLTGLVQFNQLNARADGYPKIYYPADSGSFPALKDFLNKFDPHVTNTTWTPISAQEEIPLKGDLYIRSIRNGHILTDENIHKSLSYQLIQKKRKIKPEFKEMSGNEIAKIAKEKGQSFITTELVENILGYSGDSPIEDYSRWDNTKILIHEATFLKKEAGLDESFHKHSLL